ncbi:hypothetical protein SUGI_0040550 [Cryptomeria japonica]|uniref:uncharacterized protein LOC131056048 isoform X3 n=1 Tax=Cryptomeria japonica TaxID=3369 RepID=UPI002408CABB|nr:uncharacterized protein LOC131056048 isoform X3 [Cryptomeria japonica]GLJ06506.1 hypothetical protein SUGI_0040550 [Cryptomeria japonica]
MAGRMDAFSYLFTENQWERPVCEGAVGALQDLSRHFYFSQFLGPIYGVEASDISGKVLSGVIFASALTMDYGHNKYWHQVHQFQKEASEDDLKYSLLHGSQGLRQHLLDRGEILVSGHESEEAQQLNSSGSEHQEEVEDHDELFVAQNDSIVIPETRQETILEFQQVGDNNIEESVQCDELSTPTIKKVPRKKRTQSKRMDRNK